MSEPILPKTRLIPRTRRVERQHAEEAIAHLKRAGFARFQLLAARDGWDCPECTALDGKVFNVEEPPRLPPLRCRCKPFGCRLVVVIESFLAAGKPVALVCHAPAALRHVKTSEGKPLVAGKKVTGFADTEEASVGLTEVVPFLLEGMWTQEGGKYSQTSDMQPYVVGDGLLITGQNPASSGPAAALLLKQLAAGAKS